MQGRLPFTCTIISGYRTAEYQAQLAAEGAHTAPDALSTHRSCPATGADVWPELTPTNVVKAAVGEAATVAGLRWGGGSKLDADGIPIDWNHLDLGPRRQ